LPKPDMNWKFGHGYYFCDSRSGSFYQSIYITCSDPSWLQRLARRSWDSRGGVHQIYWSQECHVRSRVQKMLAQCPAATEEKLKYGLSFTLIYYRSWNRHATRILARGL
jgi:hypothetical protein